jgi:hypothetical protein
MKTALRAKIIVESDLYGDINEADEITIRSIQQHINTKKLEIEMIHDFLTNDCEPVIIIKLK